MLVELPIIPIVVGLQGPSRRRKTFRWLNGLRCVLVEKLKFAETVKIGVRFEKSEQNFWSRIGTFIRKKSEHDLAKLEHDFVQKHKNKTYFLWA